MKNSIRISGILLILIAALTLAACTYTQRGAGIGAAVGAGAGALIGHGTKYGSGPGALVGGAIGGLGGALAGDAYGNYEARERAQDRAIRDGYYYRQQGPSKRRGDYYDNY